MLGAVVFGHQQMQTAIDAIIRLGGKGRQGPARVPEDVHAAVRES